MDVIPAPRRVTGPFRRGFPFDERTTIAAAPGTERTERWLRSTVGAALGLGLPPGEQGTGHTVTLRIDDSLDPEGYRLSVVADRGVEIAGGSGAGVFWGAQTLRSLLGPAAYRRAPVERGTVPAVPELTVEDFPRFAWRGMLLDVARHFMPKDGVLRWIDLLAAHKLNVLHLHLTDDQGWRVEIRRYPKLTEIGSWRARTKVGLNTQGPLRWDERPHGGYYTQDDIREIVAYAADRFVTVVPEIDIPGHSQAAIAAYPELGNTDVVDTTALTVLTEWGINPNVLAPTETTVAFYENVLTEILELFPADAAVFSRFVHIGGDECPKDQWRASPAAQARIRELGLTGEDELQSWFIGHFDAWLAERGRRLIGWDEILEGGGAETGGGRGTRTGLSRAAAVSSWRGYAGGIAAARAGHDVVMCPEQYVYLDHRQADGDEEPIPIGWVRTLEDVYRFEPVPPQLTADEAAHVIGTQANLWTESADNARAVDYLAFPRLAAFSEVAWSDLPPPGERDFAGFERRMRRHYQVLDALGVEYRPPSGPRPWQRRPGVAGRPKPGPPPVG